MGQQTSICTHTLWHKNSYVQLHIDHYTWTYGKFVALKSTSMSNYKNIMAIMSIVITLLYLISIRIKYFGLLCLSIQ